MYEKKKKKKKNSLLPGFISVKIQSFCISMYPQVNHVNLSNVTSVKNFLYGAYHMMVM